MEENTRLDNEGNVPAVPAQDKQNEVEGKPLAEMLGKNKEDKDKNVLKGVAIGGAALGAAGLGVGVAAAVNHDDEEEVKVEDAAPAETHTASHESVSHSQEVHVISHEPQQPETPQPDPRQPVLPTDPEQPHVTPVRQSENEAEVVAYSRTTEEDGAHSDIAVLRRGEDVVVVADADGDGEADVMARDINHNQQFDSNEVVDVRSEHISMAPLKDQANLHYVNSEPVNPNDPRLEVVSDNVETPDPQPADDPNVIPVNEESMIADNTGMEDFDNNADVDDFMA